MKTIKLLFLSAVVLNFLATGCFEDIIIRGNGIEASEGRITQNFSKVKSDGAFDVHITNGDSYDVVVNAESNLLQYIETDVNGNTLRLHIRGLHTVKNRLPMEIYISMPQLKGVVQSGSGSVTTDYFVSDDFNITISGSGTIETAVDAVTVDASISGSGNLLLSGNATDTDFAVSGSGKIDAYDLTTRDCDAKISGSGDIRTDVQRFLKATISGSGNIFYTGSPSVETHISGSGKVIHEN